MYSVLARNHKTNQFQLLPFWQSIYLFLKGDHSEVAHTTTSHSRKTHRHHFNILYCNLWVDHNQKQVYLEPLRSQEQTVKHDTHFYNLAKVNSDTTYYPEIPLGSSANCPLQHLDKELQSGIRNIVEHTVDEKTKEILVAVSILLESPDRKSVLLTRRAKFMRTFPCVWVSIGGSYELSDGNLINTAIRETKEEIGVELNQKDLNLFAMWESVFPPRLSQGTPIRHHLILYTKATLTEEQMKSIKVQPEEIDAYTFLSEENVRRTLDSHTLFEDDEEFDGFEIEQKFKSQDEIQSEIEIRTRRTKFKLSQLQSVTQNSDELPLERISTANLFALNEWLKAKEKLHKL